MLGMVSDTARWTIEWGAVGAALCVMVTVNALLCWKRKAPLAQCRQPWLVLFQSVVGGVWLVAQLVTTGALPVDPGLANPVVNCVATTLVAYTLGFSLWACSVVGWMATRAEPAMSTTWMLSAAAAVPPVGILIWACIAATGGARGFTFSTTPGAFPAAGCALTTDFRMGLIVVVLFTVVVAGAVSGTTLPPHSDYGLPKAMWVGLVVLGLATLACAVAVGLASTGDGTTVAAADTVYVVVSASAVVWFLVAEVGTAVAPLLAGITHTEEQIALRGLLALCGFAVKDEGWRHHAALSMRPVVLLVGTGPKASGSQRVKHAWHRFAPEIPKAVPGEGARAGAVSAPPLSHHKQAPRLLPTVVEELETVDPDVVAVDLTVADTPGRAQRGAQEKTRLTGKPSPQAPAEAPSVNSVLQTHLGTCVGMAMALCVPQVASLMAHTWRACPTALACMDFIVTCAAWRHQYKHHFPSLEYMLKNTQAALNEQGMPKQAKEELPQAKDAVRAANYILGAWLQQALTMGCRVKAIEHRISSLQGAQRYVGHEHAPLVPPPTHTELHLWSSLLAHVTPVSTQTAEDGACLHAYVMESAHGEECGMLMLEAMLFVCRENILGDNVAFGRAKRPARSSAFTPRPATQRDSKTDEEADVGVGVGAGVGVGPTEASSQPNPNPEPSEHRHTAISTYADMGHDDSPDEDGDLGIPMPFQPIRAAALNRPSVSPWQCTTFDEVASVVATYLFHFWWKAELNKANVRRDVVETLAASMSVAAPHLRKYPGKGRRSPFPQAL